MKIIKIVFAWIIVLAVIGLIAYGFYCWYAAAAKNERAKEAAYINAVRIEQSKPPAKVRTIEIPTAEDPYSTRY
ncbi:MAG: hypothetical protein FWF35_05055 [Elusimicrobia bacterium]|nr:hypothetical protein [Elusimicrobiota bacterium]